MKKILVTGGAGFIGSAVVRYIIQHTGDQVLNVDKLTYAGNLESLADIDSSERYHFAQADIGDKEAISVLFEQFQPDKVMHLAAESHVDRSIDGPGDFIQTNVVGTYTLLEVARAYYERLPLKRQQCFMFHHISTDEVYGDLGATGLFTEETRYQPSSPYSASKASSDHLVRAWYRTFGLPVVITNCSNNYGPYHFPEKLIPLVIIRALGAQTLPVYGDGSQIRDWLYVEDHARALYLVMSEAQVGETYNIGGHNECRNIDVVRQICHLLDEKVPVDVPRESLIEFVADRPGHDERYAIDASKIYKRLAWQPCETFETGIEKTVQWYLDNRRWWQRVLDGSYRGQRLGLK